MDSPRTPPEASGWASAWALALAWGLGPALPALARGELIGQPYTDLYPSVWGMWWFAQHQPGFPTHCELLGAPAGMPFYYSSPLHGWVAAPLIAAFGVPLAWNATLLLARIATVLCAFGAARAFGLNRSGALVAAAIYGASPFFHGYAVEGIVEGTDGWTLALWLWLLARGRLVPAALAFALTVLSSWYMAATACVLAVCLGPRALSTMLGGLAVSAPALGAFLGAFPSREPLDPSLRAMMGLQWTVRPPGALTGLQPFAMTTWVGVLAPLLAMRALRERPRGLRVALVTLLLMIVLSTGRGFWYDFPPFSALRFPYRFHAGTLLCLAWLAGHAVRKHGGWVAMAVTLEGLLLSPIEPVLPGAPADLPPLYDALPPARVLLDIPGPLAKPPGELNLSRPRARWFLYAQTRHGLASPWVPDFNAVGVAQADGLDPVRALDPLSRAPIPNSLSLDPSIDLVLVHREELHDRAKPVESLLEQAGWQRLQDDGARSLWAQRGSR